MAEEFKTWTGMAGKDPEEVKAVILAENADYQVEIMGENDPATMDLNPMRVRILVNSEGKVAFDPSVG